MRISSQLLLTFLLNAVWQVPVIACAAALGAWLLEQASAKFRHWIWVAAVFLSLLVPSFATSRIWLNTEPAPVISEIPIGQWTAVNVSTPLTVNASAASQSSSAFVLNVFAAQAIIAVYVAFLLFGVFRFIRAWHATRRIVGSTHQVEPNAVLDTVLENCQRLIEPKNVRVLCSDSLPVPVTLGARKPLIILPAKLVREGDAELLTSAVAHEFVHVARNDYFWNLVYEVVYVLLFFHPAASLIRKRVKQTRELLCDELVADRVLEPDVYARSLVTLAGAAPPLNRLSVNATVGIADADILEVRVMSLMNKSKLYPRSRKLLLIGVVLLLAVPSVTAVALAMRFDVDPFAAVNQEQENKQKEKEKEKERVTTERRSREFEEGVRAGEQEAQRRKIELSTGYTGYAEYEARERHMEEELKAQAIRNSALMRLARIPMDQAIQIATSQQPGKVVESTLQAEHWEEPGKLARDGFVFYHIAILSGDENNPTINHLWVNAVDGTIMKNEKELPRKLRETLREP